MVARALNRHATIWGDGPVDTALHRVAVDGISVILLRYGAPVKIEPLRPGTYYIVQIPLGGRAHVRFAGNQLWKSIPRMASCCRRTTMWCSTGHANASRS